MKALLVAGKCLRELSRERTLLGLVVALPAVFLSIYFFAYGGPFLPTHRVLRLSGQDGAIYALLAAAEYEDGRPMFELGEAASRTEAETELIAGDAVMLVGPANEGEQPAFEVVGDGSNMSFSMASSQLYAVASRHAALLGSEDTATIGATVTADHRPLSLVVRSEPIGHGAPRSMFEAFTPGMIVFAMLFLVPQTALLAAREVRLRTMRRLQLTRMTALDYLAGLTLAQLVVASLQLGAMLGLATLYGFVPQGSLALGVGITLLLAFSSIGFGLLVACFIDDDSQATNIGSVVTMAQVFLSGTLFTMQSPTLFTLAGHEMGAFDILPATHGMMALQQVLCYGADLGQVLFRVGAMVFLSVVLFVAGVATFGRLKMRAAR